MKTGLERKGVWICCERQFRATQAREKSYSSGQVLSHLNTAGGGAEKGASRKSRVGKIGQ